MTSTTPGAGEQPWIQAFSAKDPEAFAKAFAPDVVLEAATLRKPIQGRDLMADVMATASSIYESLVFTHQATNGPRTYIEWEATAFGGVELRGSTILTVNDGGQIVRAVIQHRPLDALLRFSAEMGKRTAGKIDPGYFYEGEVRS